MNIWFEASKMILLCSVFCSCFFETQKSRNNNHQLCLWVQGFQATSSKTKRVLRSCVLQRFIFQQLLNSFNDCSLKTQFLFLVSRGFWLKKQEVPAQVCSFMLLSCQRLLALMSSHMRNYAVGWNSTKSQESRQMPIFVKL